MLLLPAVNVQAAFDIFDNTVVIESPHPEWSPHMNFFSRHSTKRRELSEDDKRHARQQLIAGGIAGVLSRTFTAPIDRVRLLMQSAGATGRVLAAGPPSASKAVPAHRLSAAAVVRGVFSHEGVKGFWRGNGANVVKIAPGA